MLGAEAPLEIDEQLAAVAETCERIGGRLLARELEQSSVLTERQRQSDDDEDQDGRGQCDRQCIESYEWS